MDGIAAAMLTWSKMPEARKLLFVQLLYAGLSCTWFDEKGGRHVKQAEGGEQGVPSMPLFSEGIQGALKLSPSSCR